MFMRRNGMNPESSVDETRILAVSWGGSQGEGFQLRPQAAQPFFIWVEVALLACAGGGWDGEVACRDP